jgi:hypothetical protein
MVNSIELRNWEICVSTVNYFFQTSKDGILSESPCQMISSPLNEVSGIADLETPL